MLQYRDIHTVNEIREESVCRNVGSVASSRLALVNRTFILYTAGLS